MTSEPPRPVYMGVPLSDLFTVFVDTICRDRNRHATDAPPLTKLVVLNGFSFILFFGPEFSGHPCSVALREQCDIRMLCLVKKVLERIKDVDRLWRLWRSSGPRIIFLESLEKTMTADKTMMLRRTTQLLKKIQESCKKNFEDEANNKTKQLESIVSKPAGL